MTAYRERSHVWLLPGEPLLCPRSTHKLKTNATVLQHGAFVCQHTEPHQKGQCGARCFVLQFPGGLRFVAEVTQEEMFAMRDAAMGVPDVIAYLRGNAA